MSKSTQRSQPSGKTGTAKPAAKDRQRSDAFAGLQQSAGNQAVAGWLAGADPRAALLSDAARESGVPLEAAVRSTLEQRTGVNLGDVRVHQGRHSAAAAESIGARAYAIGADIHLGGEVNGLDSASRARLLAHEAIHAAQQGVRRAPLDGEMPVSAPSDRAELEAAAVANAIAVPARSSALAIRDQIRLTSVRPHIQRDITGTKTFPTGEFKIKFKKTEGTAAGDPASEDGSIKFTPSATASESNAIKFVQIVRTFDTTTGKEFDYTGSPEANRNKMQTAANAKKNISPGFFVDQIAASLTPRTKKADPAVLPFYDVTGPPLAGNVTGKRKGKTIKTAVLVDTPSFNAPLKFSFVTSAKAADTGVWYGTVLWGFETFLDKKGITKIKGEYSSFRIVQGETMDEAIRLFDQFYKNPGSPGAPTK
jgi:hypothetical protein